MGGSGGLQYSVHVRSNATSWYNATGIFSNFSKDWRVTPLILPFPDARLVLVNNTQNNNCFQCNATLASLDG